MFIAVMYQLLLFHHHPPLSDFLFRQVTTTTTNKATRRAQTQVLAALSAPNNINGNQCPPGAAAACRGPSKRCKRPGGNARGRHCQKKPPPSESMSAPARAEKAYPPLRSSSGSGHHLHMAQYPATHITSHNKYSSRHRS